MQAFLWTGVGIGCLYGQYTRRNKMKRLDQSILVVTSYNVPVEKVGEFEKVWNEYALYCQKQIGYEWTRLFKAIAWEESPYSYISTRMWTSRSYWLNMLRDSSRGLAFEEELAKIATSVSEDNFDVIVDDTEYRRIA